MCKTYEEICITGFNYNIYLACITGFCLISILSSINENVIIHTILRPMLVNIYKTFARSILLDRTKVLNRSMNCFNLKHINI